MQTQTTIIRTEVSFLDMVPLPGFSRYTICKEGFIYDTTRKVFIVGYPNSTTVSKTYMKINLADEYYHQTNFYLHRLLAEVFIPNPEGLPVVDHLDGNSLNNSIDNFRWCTAKDNNRNSKSHADSTSNYIGVCLHKANKKWKAQIKVDGKVYFLGYYIDEVDAAKAYDVAALKNGYLHHNGLIQPK